MKTSFVQWFWIFRHSKATERKKPHDSSRCEACQKGKCQETQKDFSNHHSHRYGNQIQKVHYGPYKNIAWHLKEEISGMAKTIHPNDCGLEADFEDLRLQF